MIPFFINILIALFVTTSAVVSSTSALEVKNNCCCVEVIKNSATLQDCLCCLPTPNHKLPNKAVQIQIKTASTDLHTSALGILTNNKGVKTRVLIDRRRPLHVASNELYLKKRALLI